MRNGKFEFHNFINPPFFLERIKQTKKEKKDIPEKRLNNPSNKEFVNNTIAKVNAKGLFQDFLNMIKNIPKSMMIDNKPFSNHDCSQRLCAL